MFVAAVLILFFVSICIYFAKGAEQSSLGHLPKQFVVFDLETTGLNAERHEIIEIGAIRVNRDSNVHDSFQIMIRPKSKIPKKIIDLTGITQEMIERDGCSPAEAIPQFLDFIGELPLVAFNADFDMSFLAATVENIHPERQLKNQVSCALKLARQAWPGRKSYRLMDLAKDGGLSLDDAHRALGDCKRALSVYVAAASKLGGAA